MMCRPTSRQLQVLEVYARTGSYRTTGALLGISPSTVRNTLATVRAHYPGAVRTIQAYRAAVAAGHLRR
jgi:DNA-binding CsgD family transcriptional regulator